MRKASSIVISSRPNQDRPDYSGHVAQVPTLRFLTGFFVDSPSQILPVLGRLNGSKNGTAIFM